MSNRMLRRAVATLLVLLLVWPEPARAHVRLESSSPARGAVITASPAQLQLRFSAHIEPRYTQLALFAPDSSVVPLGTVTFVNGSDRELFAAVPPLAVSGVYTVRWRTAGADGHPLEGTFTFALALPAAPAGQRPRADSATPPPSAEHAHDMSDAMDTGAATRPLAVLGRGLHLMTLTLLLGALACRVLLLPRVPLETGVMTDLRRRIWRTASFAALGLLAAALLRLYVQSAAMHGSERALSMPLLSMLLADTSWGRVWVVQAALLAVFAAALVAARPHRDRIALGMAVPAALGLATIPSLSGHAAGAEQNAAIVVANDALHVSAAGSWIGTLAIMALVALPALERTSTARTSVAEMIRRFSAVALSAAALVALSGLANALLHFTQLTQLVTTAYGRTLLLKVAFFAGVLGAGAWNWRRLQPRLAAADATVDWRRSVAFELIFALMVFVATAYLTGLPRPG